MRTRSLADDEIIQTINEYMDASEHPDLVGYREQTRERDFAQPDHFLNGLRQIVEIGGFRNKRILDVGCGFGWYSVGLNLVDASNEVVGLDILPSAIQGMNECLNSLRRRGTPVNVTAVCGDICNPDFSPGSFDAIYSNEAIEHVHDMEAMFRSCARLLKRGGRMVLINDQNCLHKKTRETIENMWKQREHSAEWCDYLRRIRPIEHADAKPFAQVREEIIKKANPHLAPEIVFEAR